MTQLVSLEDYAAKYNAGLGCGSRHDVTMIYVKAAIGELVKKYAGAQASLLEVGAEGGWQTIFYGAQIEDAQRITIYDWQDQRIERIKSETEFFEVDLEKQAFPEDGGAYDVVVCNQVFEHLKNIYMPLHEICRILKPGGLLLFSVPNVCALHNLLLTALGKQPSTTRISGSHVRGYAIHSMSEFLTFNDHFERVQLRGYGLHPFLSAKLPSVLRTYCHTPVWVLRKKASNLPTWKDIRDSTFTTTNF